MRSEKPALGKIGRNREESDASEDEPQSGPNEVNPGQPERRSRSLGQFFNSIR
jgi:hypothetical protein